MNTEKYRLAITPQLGVNDKDAVVIKWYVNDRDKVMRGQPLCCLETTKAAVDVEAEFDGVFKRVVPLKKTVQISQPLGIFFDDYDSYDNHARNLVENFSENLKDLETKITSKALRRAKELGVNISEIEAVGIIREKDVEQYAQQRTPKEAIQAEIKLHSTLKNIAIYGSGDGAFTIFESINLGDTYHVVCFLDDDCTKTGEKVGVPILQSKTLMSDDRLSNVGIALAIADSEARQRIYYRCLELGLEVINVIHPTAWLAPSAKIGQGNHIKAGAIIDSRVEIGNACIIDNNATIPHDNRIESFSHLAPGVILGSNVTVGEGAILGIGSSVATGITIGKNCIVSVGSAVTKNIPNDSVVEGIPARVIGQRRGSN